jgi:alkylhydroperoxidase family enzyme
MLGIEPETLRHLVRDVNNIGNVKTRDMILFAIKCSKNPQALLDSDVAKLYNHGLTTSQVVELIAMSAFAVYANIIADATAMDPDDMFSAA